MASAKQMAMVGGLSCCAILPNARNSIPGAITCRRDCHDLRNPISAIHGFAELIPLSGSVTTDQERFITRIIQTSQKNAVSGILAG
jgi:signal transduction histidine kinase